LAVTTDAPLTFKILSLPVIAYLPMHFQTKIVGCRRLDRSYNRSNGVTIIRATTVTFSANTTGHRFIFIALVTKQSFATVIMRITISLALSKRKG
jgi:hypothetical protein